MKLLIRMLLVLGIASTAIACTKNDNADLLYKMVPNYDEK